MPAETTNPVLSLHEVALTFPRSYGPVRVLDGISLDVAPGEVLGVVGESGSGKSLLALVVLGLVPRGAEVSGTVRFAGRDLLAVSERERERLRGAEIAIVYQDALTSLNPSLTIARQIGLLERFDLSRTPSELLEMVHLPRPARILSAYPHELSGGQRQRVLIALALSRDPALLIADEPTTALDVTVQAQIMGLLEELRRETGFTLVLVSHDLALVADAADRVAVMYAGQLMELGRPEILVAAAEHPYTSGLAAAGLSLDASEGGIQPIPGVVPSPRRFPSGCRFRDRCPRAAGDCAGTAPPLAHVGSPAGLVACYHPLPRPAGAPE